MISTNQSSQSNIQSTSNIKIRKPYEQLHYFINRPATIQVLKKKGIQYFFPIQYQTYDSINYSQDLIGRDRTGSGKTIAYSLPVIERFRDQKLFDHIGVKYLIILPTRQLCIQVNNQITSIKLTQNQFTSVSIYGGIPIYQHTSLFKNNKIDIVAATPGRLLDLLSRGCIKFDKLQTICLDQADEMLKLGFQEDVQKIFDFIRRHLHHQPQTLLFSATVPAWVQSIANKFMKKQKTYVDLIKNQPIKTSKTVQHLCMCMKSSQIIPLLSNIIRVYSGQHGRAIIFCQTKRQVNDIIRSANLRVQAKPLHGDIPQEQRQVNFKQFRLGKLKCLVATNVAARGLDIPQVDFIIQLEPPKKVDDYIHRSGRTGRAGKTGVCLTIYTSSERYLVRQIEQMANIKIKQVGPPQLEDILKADTRDVVHSLHQVNEDVLEYFQDIAQQMINDQGSLKSLTRVLAYLTKTNKRIPQKSVIGNIQGLSTYKLKWVSKLEPEKKITQNELKLYLTEKIGLAKRNSQISDIKTLTNKCLAFNISEKYRKHLKELTSKDDPNYILTKITAQNQLEEQKELQNQIQITNDQYQNAQYNKKNLELFIGNLSSNPNINKLYNLFKQNLIRFAEFNQIKNEEGQGRGFGFLLCLTESDVSKAINLDGYMFEGKQLKINKPKPKIDNENEKQNGRFSKQNGFKKSKEDFLDEDF